MKTADVFRRVDGWYFSFDDGKPPVGPYLTRSQAIWAAAQQIHTAPDD
jgi:hypothetical protein